MLLHKLSNEDSIDKKIADISKVVTRTHFNTKILKVETKF